MTPYFAPSSFTSAARSPSPATTSRSSAGKNSFCVFFSWSLPRCGRMSEIRNTGSPGSSPTATSTTVPSVFTITP